MIIGIVSDFVLNPKIEDWISDKLDDIIKRGKAKDATFIIMDSGGMSQRIIKKLKDFESGFFVVSYMGMYDYPSAICTFKADIEFMSDLADYVVIISNGEVHTEWAKLRTPVIARLEVNYLLKKEKFIKGETW